MSKLTSVAVFFTGLVAFTLSVYTSTASSRAALGHSVKTDTAVQVYAEPTPTVVTATSPLRVSARKLAKSPRERARPKIQTRLTYTHVLVQGGSPLHQTVRVWENI